MKMNLQAMTIFGGYSERNTGDDSFAVIAAWGAHKYWQTKKISFFTYDIPIMPELPLDIEFLSTAGNPLIDYIKKTYSLCNAVNCLWAGGSVFTAAYDKKIKTLKFLSKLKGTRIGAIGVSVGPFKNVDAENGVKEFLKHFSFLTLRDYDSYQLVNSYNLPFKPVLAFDLAGLLPKVYTEYDPDHPGDGIGVSLCFCERYFDGDKTVEDRRIKRTFQMLDLIVEKIKPRMKFFIVNDNPRKGDQEITRNAFNRYKDKTDVELIDYSRNPGDMFYAIKKCRLMISTRLHGGIYACMAGKPFFSIEYHRKNTEFLKEVGCPEDFKLGDMDATPDEAVRKIIDVYETPSMFYKIDREALIKRAEANFVFMENKL